MFTLTRILSLAATYALLALTTASIPVRAECTAQDQGPVDPYASILTEQDTQQQMGECTLLKGAISRRACLAQVIWEAKRPVRVRVSPSI